jgi:hypothetical protein
VTRAQEYQREKRKLSILHGIEQTKFHEFSLESLENIADAISAEVAKFPTDELDPDRMREDRDERQRLEREDGYNGE